MSTIMSSTTTTATAMEDSGISTAASSMLRLSSTSASGGNTDDQHHQPMVKMPNSSQNASLMQDSGICSDLLKRLSLGDNVSSASELSAYFEPDEDGDVQLHLAVASGLADVVDALVRMSPSPDHLSLQNNQGYSPLHIAVLQNQPAFVRRLVMAGARLDLPDDEGNNPLHLSARRGYLECAEALLASSPAPDQLFNHRNNLGQHCVHLATMGGHVQFLQFLSWKGADMNALEGRSGRSSLHLAVGARSLPLVQCLAEPKPTGCGLDPCLLDWYGRTPYQLSLMNGQSDIALFLASRTPNASTEETAGFWGDAPSDSESEELYNNAAALVNSSA